MSLINDALKKANRPGQSSGNSQSPAVGLRPANDSSKSAGGAFRAVVAVAASLMVLAAGWFIWNALKAANDQTPAAQTDLPKQAPAHQSVAEKPPLPAAPAAGLNPPSRIEVNTNTIVRRPDAPGAAAASSAPAAAPDQTGSTPFPDTVAQVPPPSNPPTVIPAVWPEIRLQAIFYRLTKSSARINGQVVSVGDSVGAAKITAIERDRVELEMSGEKKVIQVLKGK
jgi:hypothetical protein